MLIGLPLLGNFHVVDALDAEGERLVEELYTAMVKSKYSSNKATYLSWVKYFKDGMGKKSVPTRCILCLLALLLSLPEPARRCAQ